MGVKFTEAGATYPYGVDPHDSMIRIAPSLPPVEELEEAMDAALAALQQPAVEETLPEETVPEETVAETTAEE